MSTTPGNTTAPSSNNNNSANLPSIVVVSDHDGRKFKMVLRGSLEKLSVTKIKHYLENSTKIPTKEQQLQFNGITLDDHLVGGDFGLYADAVLHLQKTSVSNNNTTTNSPNNNNIRRATGTSSSSSAAANTNSGLPVSPPVQTSANEAGTIRSSIDTDTLGAFSASSASTTHHHNNNEFNTNNSNSNVSGGGGRATVHSSLQEPVHVSDHLRFHQSLSSTNNTNASPPTSSSATTGQTTLPQRVAPQVPDLQFHRNLQQHQQQHQYSSSMDPTSTTVVTDPSLSASLLSAENASLKKEIDKLRGRITGLEAAQAAEDPRHPGGFPAGGVLAAARVQLQGLSKELGVPLELDDNFTCVIGSEDATVLVTVDPQTERLYLYSTLLASMPTENEKKCTAIYKSLLEWSMLGRDLAGGCIGVDSSTGTVIMSTSIDLKNSRSPALRDTAPVFVEALARWRQAVAKLS